jgi:hypothetical protein
MEFLSYLNVYFDENDGTTSLFNITGNAIEENEPYSYLTTGHVMLFDGDGKLVTNSSFRIEYLDADYFAKIFYYRRKAEDGSMKEYLICGSNKENSRVFIYFKDSSEAVFKQVNKVILAMGHWLV